MKKRKMNVAAKFIIGGLLFAAIMVINITYFVKKDQKTGSLSFNPLNAYAQTPEGSCSYPIGLLSYGNYEQITPDNWTEAPCDPGDPFSPTCWCDTYTQEFDCTHGGYACDVCGAEYQYNSCGG